MVGCIWALLKGLVNPLPSQLQVFLGHIGSSYEVIDPSCSLQATFYYYGLEPWYTSARIKFMWLDGCQQPCKLQ